MKPKPTISIVISGWAVALALAAVLACAAACGIVRVLAQVQP